MLVDLVSNNKVSYAKVDDQSAIGITWNESLTNAIAKISSSIIKKKMLIIYVNLFAWVFDHV